MRTLDKMEGEWPFFLISFEGCGNAIWLVKLPINMGPKKETHIELNHPWTHEMVSLEYRGQMKKRHEVAIFQQKERPKPTTKVYSPLTTNPLAGFHDFR